MSRPGPRFGPLLPPVYRGTPGGDGQSVMDRFLQAFEDVYAEIVTEIEAVPSLLSLTPTPSLEADAQPGDSELLLDTASGIHPGDWLLIDGTTVTFVQVAEVAAAPDRYQGLALVPQVRPGTQAETQSPGLFKTATVLHEPHAAGEYRLRLVPFPDARPFAGDVLELLVGTATVGERHRIVEVLPYPGWNGEGEQPPLELLVTPPLTASYEAEAEGHQVRLYAAPRLTLEVDGEIQALLPPVRVRLAGSLLPVDYPVRTKVATVGRVAGETSLLVPALTAESRLQVTPFAGRPPAPGDVLELSAPPGAADSAPELLKVIAMPAPHEVVVTPALRRSYPIGWSVQLRPAPPVTNPAGESYPYTERTGAELVLSAEVGPGEMTLEPDTLQGIQPGDRLLVWDRNPAAVEFATVAEVLTVDERERPGWRRGVILTQPVRSPHEIGTALHVLGSDGPDTFLEEDVAALASVIRVAEPDRLGLRAGQVLRLECTDEAVCADTGELFAGPEFALVLAVNGRDVTLSRPLRREHSGGTRVVRVHLAGSGTAHLAQLAGWIGVSLRPGRGERWQREWLRRAAALWRYRGTRIGFEGLLTAYLRNEAQATVYDLCNPMQVGLVSTIGTDTAVGGGFPYHYWARLHMDPHRITSYQAEGLGRLLAESSALVHHETPAHTRCDVVLHANTMRISPDPDRMVGVRVGVTTLIWEKPLPVRIDREDRGMRG